MRFPCPDLSADVKPPFPFLAEAFRRRKDGFLPACFRLVGLEAIPLRHVLQAASFQPPLAPALLHALALHGVFIPILHQKHKPLVAANRAVIPRQVAPSAVV